MDSAVHYVSFRQIPDLLKRVGIARKCRLSKKLLRGKDVNQEMLDRACIQQCIRTREVKYRAKRNPPPLQACDIMINIRKMESIIDR